MRRLLPATLAVIILVACCGCGAEPGTLGDLVSVKGKVTYKGQPLTSGVVHFEPDGYGRPATGKLQPDGSYTLSTMKEGDGAVAGEHIVTIGGFDKPLASDRTLKKYGSRRDSHLTAEVDADHAEFNFDLQ